DAKVLHRGVEALLDDGLQAVDLVDEEDVALAERGEDAGEVALAFERRAGGDAAFGAHLVGEQVREGRLAEAGRAREQYVVEGVAALARRLDVDGEVVGDLLLADELREAARAQRRVVVGSAGRPRRLGGEHARRGEARVLGPEIPVAVLVSLARHGPRYF